ncbi:CST complex subunit TEN1-like [Sycon ciliatum]|uniref:CST complex subunit TEN1-like n=1 Tax=Sycon ciliatum TaxID=27933 RepID=UPI0020AA91EC|eukprot:scpid93418/ scgid9735/ CST complex subunit TEN1; Protein telomeric pathways with STN1 homolog; Telomere length regulation protein TEN1 homolog
MSMRLQSGRVLKLDEVVQQGSALDGKAVRTIGKLVQLNPVSSTAVLSGSDGSRLTVSTRLVEPFPYRLHSLIQLIGEMEVTGGGECVIVPRVARCVDGLDVRLHNEALGVWRQFLEKQQMQQQQQDENDELPSDIFDM